MPQRECPMHSVIHGHILIPNLPILRGPPMCNWNATIQMPDLPDMYGLPMCCAQHNLHIRCMCVASACVAWRHQSICPAAALAAFPVCHCHTRGSKAPEAPSAMNKLLARTRCGAPSQTHKLSLTNVCSCVLAPWCMCRQT